MTRTPLIRTVIIALLVVTLCVGAGLFLSGYVGSVPLADRSDEIVIYSTIYPWAEAAREVAGETADVRTLVPAGAEPHEFEPTPQDIVALSSADVVLINGAGLDAWAEKLRPGLEAKGVAVLLMSEGVALREGARDPHVWLDPTIVARQTRRIRDILSLKVPHMAGVYADRAEQSVARLAALDQDYRERLDRKRCRQDTIVVSHDAYGYLAARYGFRVEPIAGLTPEAEPSSRRMAEIADFIRERGITVIFFETLVSPKVAETLAQEAGVRTLTLNPLEGLTANEERAGMNYETIMRENLRNLEVALECGI